MERPPQCPSGLWSSHRVSQSQQSRQRIQLMKEESRLRNFQKKKIQLNTQKGSSSTVTCPPPPAPPAPAAPPHTLRSSSYVPQRRSAEACRSGNSYEREKFRPGPTRDLEKEKRRLQSIFFSGQEEPAADDAGDNDGSAQEKDRYDEVLEEIEDRQQFLEDMDALGHGSEYVDIINAEIAQKKRELDLLENARRAER